MKRRTPFGFVMVDDANGNNKVFDQHGRILDNTLQGKLTFFAESADNGYSSFDGDSVTGSSITKRELAHSLGQYNQINDYTRQRAMFKLALKTVGISAVLLTWFINFFIR